RMRWWVFGLFTFAALVLQRGLEGLWHVWGVTPNLLLILAAFVVAMAPRETAVWCVVILGVLADVMSPYQVIGPGPLGYLAGAGVVLWVRPGLAKGAVTRMLFTTAVIGGVMHLSVIVLLTLRGLPMIHGLPADWSLGSELGRRMMDLVYTTAAAGPIG